VLLSEQPVASSIDELLAGATHREPMSHTDGKSGVPMERVVIDGERYVVKHLHVDDDWIMRTTCDVLCRPLLVWQSGLLDRLPTSIDHAMVGAAAGLGRHGWGSAILMQDVSPWLVPEGDDPIEREAESRFLDHMAELHASLWGWEDHIGLLPPASRLCAFGPYLRAAQGGSGSPVLGIADDGWRRLTELAPAIGTAVAELRHAPWPLVDALGALPQTFLHGDWKFGNLGTHPDGRTILLDWAVPGRGFCLLELGWWLQINAARIPTSKETNLELYRGSLERHGIDTSMWWERGVDLALLAGMITLGWEKAYQGPGPELDWWLERTEVGLRRL
jgi:hypothetical protein